MSAPRRARALFAVAVLVHLAVVYAPSANAPGAGIPHADKLVHMLIFAAVAWTGIRAGLPALPLGLALGAHAVASEVVQGALLPARSGDPWDTAADLVGVALGLTGAGRPRPSGRRGVRRDAGRSAAGGESMGA